MADLLSMSGHEQCGAVLEGVWPLVSLAPRLCSLHFTKYLLGSAGWGQGQQEGLPGKGHMGLGVDAREGVTWEGSTYAKAAGSGCRWGGLG